MSIPLTARITPEDALAIAEYEKQYAQYEQDMEVYNNRIKEYNAGSRTESFQYTQPTAPVPTVSQQQVSERTQEDLQRRSMGVSAFGDPSQFNLSGFGIGSLPSVGNLAGFSSRSFGGIGGFMGQGQPVRPEEEDQVDPNVAFDSRYGPIRYGTADSEIHTLGDGRQFRREEFDRFGQSFGIAGMSPLQQEYNRFLYRMGQEVQGMRR
jgi:hypothetical protein